MKKIITILVLALGFTATTFAQKAESEKSERRYTYYENDGIFMYYETKEVELFRQLLPNEFDMPDRLLVHAFINDFYKMDAKTQPYKEVAIFLLAKYKGKEIWHCIYMPVTSRESMWAGIIRLGLPKSLGQIEFTRSSNSFSGNSIDEDGTKMAFDIDTNKNTIAKKDENLLKELSVIPKMNIKNGIHI